jgi:cobyrinic acid a,c-diamide synthase
MRYFGAEIVSFSPLADSSLPKDIGGIYFTGAYLSEYGEELAANETIKQKIKDFARSGGLIYSEGAGTAYLCKDFSGPNGSLPGVGLINGSAVCSPARLSYTEAVTMEESIYGRAGLIFKGINTYEWRIIESKPNIKVVRFAKGGDEKSSYEGYSPGAQMLSTLSFPHFGSNPAIAKNIIDAAEVVKKLG